MKITKEEQEILDKIEDEDFKEYDRGNSEGNPSSEITLNDYYIKKLIVKIRQLYKK